MGIGKNITAMPQYFHMDVKTESNVVNGPDFQENGHLVDLSCSMWQATLFWDPLFSRNHISVQPVAPNVLEVLILGRQVLYTYVSLKLDKWGSIFLYNFIASWICLVYRIAAITQPCGSFSITHLSESLSGGHFIGDLFCFNYKVIHLANCVQDLWYPFWKHCCLKACSLAPTGASVE